MKVYDTAHIRNVALLGHGDAGKTSLTAALAFGAGATDNLGSVLDGTAVTDFDAEEIQRKVSMSVAVAYLEHGACKINLIDAPGYTNFIGEAAAALRAADCAMLTVHAVHGIEVQTEKMFEDAESDAKPLVFTVTQLDRENTDFATVVETLIARFGRQVMPIALPIGAGEKIEGVVCLVTGKALRPKSGGREVEIADPPAEMADAIATAREQLIEMVAESDDELMNAFLEEGELSDDQFRRGLALAIASRSLFPVFATAAPKMVGVHQILEALVGFAPSPADRPLPTITDADGQPLELTADPDGPLVAQVFKTYIDKFAGQISLLRVFSGKIVADQNAWNADTETAERLSGLAIARGKEGTKVSEVPAGDIGFVTKLKATRTGSTLVADKGSVAHVAPIPFPEPVIAYAVHGEGKGDDEKIARSLAHLAEEDPTLRLSRDPRTHELMLHGLGIDHVRTAMDKMEHRDGVKGILQKPKIPYLETITKAASGDYRHKKQSGGAGQFAEVHMRIEPLPRGGGFEYASEIVGGAISRNFWPSIEKGVKQIMEEGVIAGYPLRDVKAVIFDGKEHPVDSKDIAFQIAGRQVFKACVMRAAPVVLEPVMKVVVTCPDENMGDILGDLSRRRGKVQGSDSQSGRSIVRALVPMAEMLEYSATLKSLTQDRGSFTMELASYEKVPAEIQQELMAAYKPQDSED